MHLRLVVGPIDVRQDLVQEPVVRDGEEVRLQEDLREEERDDQKELGEEHWPPPHAHTNQNTSRHGRTKCSRPTLVASFPPVQVRRVALQPLLEEQQVAVRQRVVGGVEAIACSRCRRDTGGHLGCAPHVGYRISYVSD